MSGKKSFFRMNAGALIALSLLASCASQSTVDDANAPELAGTDTSLSDSNVATSDSDVFADLRNDSKDAPAEATMTEVSGSDSPYYSAIGGEKLGRVAHTIYGSKRFTKVLAKKNTDISVAGTLSAGQKVYFDFNNANPQAKYLTKDLLDRYSAPLAEALQTKSGEKGFTKTSVVLGQGETLQAMAKKLYGSSRYWPEIYLLNHDKLSSYDKVKAGTTLVVYQRDMAAPIAAAPVSTPQYEQPVAQPVMPSGPAVNAAGTMDTPMTTQSAAAPVIPAPEPAPIADPIPETPISAAPPATPATASVEVQSGGFADLGNPTTRRILYVALIFLIIGLAFLFTKQKKKKPFDMLDSTARDTVGGRSKLMDSHNKVVG